MSLDELSKTRKSIKGSITRITNFIENFVVSASNVCELTVREEQLKTYFKKYDEIQTKLEELAFDIHALDRDVVEPKYYTALAKIESSKKITPIVVPSEAQARPNVSVKLPILNIPQFTGDYHSWSAFRDLFKSLVHNDPTLTPVQKLCYLKGSLINEPKQIIDSLMVNNDNYETAWNLLNERYENKYLLVNSHVKAILELSTSSKNTVGQLRELILTVKQQMNSLKALSMDVSNWDILIIFILNQKVDIQTRKAWELQRVSSDIPTLIDYFAFLEHRCNALELSTDSNPTKKTAAHVSLKSNKNCPLCNKDHFIQECPKFLKQSVDDRQKTVRTQNLCINCLRSSHRVQNCRSSNCRTCGRRHNTLLHFTNNQNLESTTLKPNLSNPGTSGTDLVQANAASFHANRNPAQVLLCTARILVRDNQDNFVTCRALLDSGSQANFVKASLVNKLGLKTYRSVSTVTSVTDSAKRIQSGVSIQIASRLTKFNQILEFSILDKITLPLPHIQISTEHWPIPRHIQFADPTFYKPDEIEMLIGAEIFLDILQNGHLSLGRALPTLRNTQFGWIVAGNVPIHQNSHTVVNLHTQIDLSDMIARFWRLEELSDKPILTAEEKQCEEIFRETTTRDSTGRYIVELPLKPNYRYNLGSSYPQALKRFYALERRFANNSPLYKEYKTFIEDYVALGHAEVLAGSEDNSLDSYYMPHHAVIKPESVSTKLRVVFDASMSSASGKSLNDVLMTGPTLQSDLFDIILRFRTYLHVFTTDIVKMFRQILVAPDHQPLQRILWRDAPTDPLKIIQLKTVTYGTACAPYLAQRCLLQLSEDEASSYPLASEVLKRDTYMDDILSGSNSPHTLEQLKSELIELLQRGGFQLHKWRSNLASIQTELTDASKIPQSQTSEINHNQAGKTLGLTWLQSQDTFTLSVPKEFSQAGDTKRQVLSFISKIFDPLGLITPVSIQGKILLQRMWSAKLDWDVELSRDILTDWHNLKHNLHELQSITIERSLLVNKDIKNIQLHAFCDASIKAYGACVYLRVTYHSSIITSRLICSKSRVAPLKTISIPRLELCGAVLLARLTSKIYSILVTTKIDSVHLWSDSKIVLSWIKSSSRRWNTFVAHRISEIQELTSQFEWNYVATTQNPADLITRGLPPRELSTSILWWQGPSWLGTPKDNWPTTPQPLFQEDLPEERKVVTLAQIEPTWTRVFQRFSKITRLVHTFAYVRRFIEGCKRKLISPNTNLSAQELEDSRLLILKLMQGEAFTQEIDILTQVQPSSSLKRSTIKQLNPFIDESGLIRVGGRLRNAKIPFSQKHPILLPTGHHITYLIIEHEHKKLLHAGVQTVLANLRMKYWPIHAKRNIKHILLKCVTCHRFKAPILSQIMADLPEERVVPSRPFQCVGVDYAGPITIKLSTLRRPMISKSYIAVFVCLASKAVHLELVSDLTTNAFIAALSRFVARRGKPSLIYSDNATNFKGADNEMKRLYELKTDIEHIRAITQFAASKEMTWKYIPPNSPSWGGIWEAAVKSVKYHLIRVVGTAKLTFEQLTTLLCQIESILNSRPLCSLSNDPNDYSYLSPSHFLFGDYMHQLPEEDFRNTKLESLKLYARLTKMRQEFWDKWSKDYLSLLQHRPKWHNAQPNLTPGILVLIKDDGQAPGMWSLGRIIEMYPGVDGRVRVALVKTATGTYKRPIVKLSPLPEQGLEAQPFRC